MPPQYKTERLLATSPADLARASHLLRSGETVAFPTETVYGLGAHALDPQAVEKIFLAKQRPHWDPLIVHIADRSQLPAIAHTGPQAEALMDRFWPGPLTLLLPRTPAIPDAVTAGRPLVGVRIPAHPVALALLQQAGIPVAAPSANTFGHTSPTSARHVLDDLDGRLAAVLDGGPTTVGLESTVAELTAEGPLVYRPGAITLEMLDEVCGPGSSWLYAPELSASKPESLPSPGVGIRHYAPRARLVLIPTPAFSFNPPDQALTEAVADAVSTGEAFGVMLPDGWPIHSVPYLFPWGPWDQPDLLAQRLFAGLRALDDAGVTSILCPVPPGHGIAAAIRDRLSKAARPG